MPMIEGDGVELYAEEAGDGHPIVWLHEFAADYRTWEGQIRRFSRSHRCIAYNARGYPPSDVPQDDSAYTFEHEREDLRAVLDSLGIERAHLVGLSMGAYTGLMFALRYPERVTSLLFASGGSGAFGDTREAFLAEVRAAAEAMMNEGMEVAAERLAVGATRVQLQNKDPRGWAEFKQYLSEHSAIGSGLTMRNFQGRSPVAVRLRSRVARTGRAGAAGCRRRRRPGHRDERLPQAGAAEGRLVDCAAHRPRDQLGRACCLQPDGGGLLQRSRSRPVDPP